QHKQQQDFFFIDGPILGTVARCILRKKLLGVTCLAGCKAATRFFRWPDCEDRLG
ncbi:MAG: hypothetical protein QOG23_5445, partial [Blastocatellia bacterium]|nr:hypothetical protein [Blastocatellia bacterium]